MTRLPHPDKIIRLLDYDSVVRDKSLWFAWYPIRIGLLERGCWVWLKWVIRQEYFWGGLYFYVYQKKRD